MRPCAALCAALFAEGAKVVRAVMDAEKAGDPAKLAPCPAWADVVGGEFMSASGGSDYGCAQCFVEHASKSVVFKLPAFMHLSCNVGEADYLAQVVEMLNSAIHWGHEYNYTKLVVDLQGNLGGYVFLPPILAGVIAPARFNSTDTLCNAYDFRQTGIFDK